MIPAHFLPTEYTAALMLRLRQHSARLAGGSALEIGTGSGLVMATLLAQGAQQALGVDVESGAVACTRELLADLGLSERAQVVQGDMWAPCAGQRFDVIVANLPQFPVQHTLNDGRLPSWSSGGADGRALVDPFLRGLALHLAPGGLAVMTHNSFISLERTQVLLAESSLQAQVASTVSVPLPRHKLQGLPTQVLQAYLGQGLHLLGDGAFADFHVLDIGHATAAQR